MDSSAALQQQGTTNVNTNEQNKPTIRDRAAGLATKAAAVGAAATLAVGQAHAEVNLSGADVTGDMSKGQVVIIGGLIFLVGWKLFRRVFS